MINGKEIKQVAECHFRGTILEEKLNRSSHAEKIGKTFYQLVGTLKKRAPGQVRNYTNIRQTQHLQRNV